VTEIVDTIDQLTPEWFTEALREDGVLPGGASVANAGNEIYGTGQFGFVVRSELGYEGDAGDAPESVIVKIPSDDETARGFAKMIGAYEVEVRFYSEILPRVDVDAPRAYWGDVEQETNRFTLVLEDLTADRQVGDAIAGGTPEQAAAAMDQLVKLQAPVWDDPGLRELEWLSSPARTAALFGLVEPAMPAFKERFGPRVRDEDMALAEGLAPKAALYPERAWQGPLVPIHGDYRLDNLMFAEGADGLNAKVIDFQSVRLGPPLIDHGIYLSSCLSLEDRREHQDALLRRYHEGLVDAGVNDFSFDDCMESYRQGSLYLFLLSVGAGMNLKQTERGDELFGVLFSMGAELVRELDAASFLD
jgi:hypothetical protein